MVETKKQKKAFTLVEIIVSSLIIALILMCSLPILTRVKPRTMTVGRRGMFACWYSTDGKLHQRYMDEKSTIDQLDDVTECKLEFTNRPEKFFIIAQGGRYKGNDGNLYDGQLITQYTATMSSDLLILPTKDGEFKPTRIYSCPKDDTCTTNTASMVLEAYSAHEFLNENNNTISAISPENVKSNTLANSDSSCYLLDANLTCTQYQTSFNGLASATCAPFDSQIGDRKIQVAPCDTEMINASEPVQGRNFTYICKDPATGMVQDDCSFGTGSIDKSAFSGRGGLIRDLELTNNHYVLTYDDKLGYSHTHHFNLSLIDSSFTKQKTNLGPTSGSCIGGSSSGACKVSKLTNILNNIKDTRENEITDTIKNLYYDEDTKSNVTNQYGVVLILW